MPNKKVCKQYPNVQYGPCAPDISGKWDVYLSGRTKFPNGTTKTENINYQITIEQENLYFKFISTYGEKIGMLYPVGNCWEAKTVDDDDNGIRTLKITRMKNRKATRMIVVYTESGFQPSKPEQEQSIAVENWYRID